MKCYGIVRAEDAKGFQQACWITLSSGSVLLCQDADYASFASAVAAVSGAILPMFYSPTVLTADQMSALAPISLAGGSTMLQLAAAAAAMNPLMSL